MRPDYTFGRCGRWRDCISYWSRRLFFVTLLTIFYLAFAPHVDVGPDFEQADKLKHAAAFVVLTLLYGFGFGGKWLKIFGWMLLIGCFIEIVQYFLPYRDASILDIIADSIGIIIGNLVRENFPIKGYE